MKKIFTLILGALLFCSAQAQVEFIHEGKTVANGETITFEAEVLDLGGGFIILTCEPTAPFIKNTSASDQKISVKVEKGDMSDDLTWCGITEACLPMSKMTETRSNTFKAGEEKGLSLHANFTEGNFATYTAKVTASGGGVSRTINVKFVYEETSAVESTLTDANKVTCQGKNLTFHFEDGANHTARVYSTTGALVFNKAVGDGETVSLDHLPNGVYVYSVKLANNKQTAGKVVLK